MADKKSGYPVQQEIESFMKLHTIDSIDTLISISNEKLFQMEGITMHMMSEIYTIREKKGIPNQ